MVNGCRPSRQIIRRAFEQIFSDAFKVYFGPITVCEQLFSLRPMAADVSRLERSGSAGRDGALRRPRRAAAAQAFAFSRIVPPNRTQPAKRRYQLLSHRICLAGRD